MNVLKRYPTALTIAGSDSGGGAGIQADLKTFSALGVFGASVITSITAQNTHEVRAVEVLSTTIIRQQLEAVLEDITVDAIKTGMLPTPEIIKTVAEIIDQFQLKKVVIDSVMVATSRARLVSADTVGAFREYLYPRLTVITPNIPEAEALSGITIATKADVYEAGKILLNQGCQAVLIKGGHLDGESQAIDILFQQESEPYSFSSEFIETQNLHGTGCSLASAITAFLSLGHELEKSVELAKEYISQAIAAGAEATTGKGNGPINHFFEPKELRWRHVDDEELRVGCQLSARAKQQ